MVAKKIDFSYSFRSDECGNLDCSEYYIYGNYWTTTEYTGYNELNIHMTFSRPKDQSLLGLKKLRFGFWIDSNGSESMSCGWGYKPMNFEAFECFSFRSDMTIQDTRNDAFQVFSNIRRPRHHDYTWKRVDYDIPAFNGFDFGS